MKHLNRDFKRGTSKEIRELQEKSNWKKNRKKATEESKIKMETTATDRATRAKEKQNITLKERGEQSKRKEGYEKPSDERRQPSTERVIVSERYRWKKEDSYQQRVEKHRKRENEEELSKK